MEDQKHIYVVECSSGSWGSYHWWIGGIFNNPQDAESVRDKLNAEAKAIIDEAPHKDKDPDDLSDEEEREYMQHFSNRWSLREWRPAVVKKYPLNVKIKQYQ
jgi:hypothetical protein